MSGDDLLDISLCIELHLVDTYLTVESMDGVGIVVTVIYDVVIVAIDEYGVVAGAMDGAIGIGLQDAAFILVGSHWSLFADGILHAVGVVVA